MRSDKQIALDYARAYAAYLDAQTHLSKTKTAFVALLVKRRQRGDSNKSLAAEFGLPSQLIHRSVVNSPEYQAVKDAERRAYEAAWRERTPLTALVDHYLTRSRRVA